MANKLRGWRRLIFCSGVVVITAAALFFGKIKPEDWVETIKWLSSFYIGSDGVEKMAGAIQAKVSAKPGATSEPAEGSEEKRDPEGS